MTDIAERIRTLKEEKDAVILAHFYQTMDIQNIADHVGDSFELARRAQAASRSIIVLCGVAFMAESAKILNPDKTVLLPALEAGCPMADMVSPEDIRDLRRQYTDAAVMCYVNSSAAVKAESDVCCTSSSAIRIAHALPQQQIIFVPDQNLGQYVASRVPEKEFILFRGFCPTHYQVRQEDVTIARRDHPGALILVHPECRPEVVAAADFVGSTAEILNYVHESPARDFIIGTELGVVERLRQIDPDKQAFLLSDRLLCPNMKKTRLTDVLNSLEQGVHEINLTEQQIAGARASLERMIAIR